MKKCEYVEVGEFCVAAKCASTLPFKKRLVCLSRASRAWDHFVRHIMPELPVDDVVRLVKDQSDASKLPYALRRVRIVRRGVYVKQWQAWASELQGHDVVIMNGSLRAERDIPAGTALSLTGRRHGPVSDAQCTHMNALAGDVQRRLVHDHAGHRRYVLAGPVSLARHSHVPNCRLVVTSPQEVMIVVDTAIAAGEEILVDYGRFLE